MKYNFKPYLNPVFIESGTYAGEGVRAALRAGFESIISIELSDYYFSLCRERYKNFSNVQLLYGDSVLVLPKVLKNINQCCTFWLDGHWMGGEEVIKKTGIYDVPLMEELKIIATHPIKEHTILIDDMRLVRDKNSEWGPLINFCTCDIEEMIHSINPKYKITYVDGYKSDDILVAQVK